MAQLFQSDIQNGHPWTEDGEQIDCKLLQDLKPQEQTELLSWIRANILPRKTANKICSSYGLKHYAEHDLGFYISNNQFKDAMLQCEFYPVNQHEINWFYRISNKSPCILIRRK